MRGSARPDNALFQGKLASGWPINRKDNREAARILLPGRMESVPVSALAVSSRGCRDPLAVDYRAAVEARLSAPNLTSFRKAGLWFSGQNDARSKL
jgi:hypothetical protein